jgi:hypothetical protein
LSSISVEKSAIPTDIFHVFSQALQVAATIVNRKLHNSFISNSVQYRLIQVHVVASWLRRYATTWKVAGLRPDEVIEFLFFFNFPNPFGRTRHWGLLSL